MEDTHFHVEVLGDGKVTVAQVEFVFGDTIYYGRGHSTRMPGDIYDEEVGEGLAILRATESMLAALKTEMKEKVLAVKSVPINPPKKNRKSESAENPEDVRTSFREWLKEQQVKNERQG